MIAEIITIGSEIVTGTIVDKNASFLSKNLTKLGLLVKAIHSVGDNLDDIVNILNLVTPRADLIVLTGGLGPTEDDVTKEAVARFLNVELIYCPELEEDLIRFYGDKLSNKHKIQARIPKGSNYLKTDWGSAPGFIYEGEKYSLISLPGVPYELIRIFNNLVKDLLIKKYGQLKSRQKLRIRTFGLYETQIETKIMSIIKRLNLNYGVLAGSDGVDLFIEHSQNKDLSEEEVKEITRALGRSIYAIGDQSLAEVVGKLVHEKKQTFAVAESCTGGLFASIVTSIPGSSNYFYGGIVAYHNLIKEGILDVENELLEKRGAVSAETAMSMSKNIRKKMGTDWGVSITGIAGPNGGTKEKPVGLVYIGLIGPGAESVEKCNFFGDRRTIQERAVYSAFNLFRLNLIK